MSDETRIQSDALARLKWPLRLTRLGLMAERVVRGFWPVWTIAFATIAALAFGIADHLPRWWLIVALGAAGLAMIWALITGLRNYRHPTRAEALARLDQTLPGRPILSLVDHQAIGEGDVEARAVWRAHLSAMAAQSAEARAPGPDLRVSDRDPYGLRFIALSALIMALMFGTFWRVADLGAAVAGAPALPGDGGPTWEGWVEPPLYTGRPSLYLNDITGERFEVPIGARITLRIYGEASGIAISETIQINPPAPIEGAASRQISLDRSGTLTIEGAETRMWELIAIPDQGPSVSLPEPVSGVPPGAFQMRYEAQDDYGIAGGTLSLALNPAAADRRYGLAVAPEPREAVTLPLPLPFTGTRDAFTEVLVEDLSQHPFANLPVTIRLTVEDDAGQEGVITQELDRLPGRRFFNPLANALIEMRRDLLWSRDNAGRVAQLLRAISHRGEALFEDEESYRRVRGVIARLEAGGDGISGETRDALAAILWEVAIALDDGDLADALERLRRAQDRLAEAMRQGASDEEIAELMEELREAMDDYMQELADSSEAPGTDEPDQSGEQMEFSQNDLDEMLRRIEELMQQGRMTEAQEMLEALRQMMENMQVTQGGEGQDGPRSPGQQAMEGLQNTLRDQQGLSDQAFQDLQERFNPGQGAPDQPGEEGNQQGNAQGGENDGDSLAEQQRALREQLQEQAQNLPGRGTPEGDEAYEQLREADRAMRDAIGELERGDLADALDSQSQAMEALRDGMEQLGQALAAEDGGEPGQGDADGAMAADRPIEDPLGRQAGNAGGLNGEGGLAEREEAHRRARDLMDEIRRRSAELGRPEIELDYLRRLLERFGGE